MREPTGRAVTGHGRLEVSGPVGRLVVIEGLDGAGKHTLTERLYAAFAARGARVTPFAFPRYDADVHAELARDALHGRLGDLAGSVHGMAVLFALDAARVGLGLSVVEAVSVSAAMIGNVGPAFGIAGPLGSYEPFSDLSKLLMIVLMWLGRLEIIPVAVLLSRHYWRTV